MTHHTNMSTPVTRGELREELDLLERRFDEKLDLVGGALLARITELEERLFDELARHTRATFESMTKLISAVGEKYNDLPGRVAQLEGDVHPLKQR